MLALSTLWGGGRRASGLKRAKRAGDIAAARAAANAVPR